MPADPPRGPKYLLSAALGLPPPPTPQGAGRGRDGGGAAVGANVQGFVDGYAKLGLREAVAAARVVVTTNAVTPKPRVGLRGTPRPRLLLPNLPQSSDGVRLRSMSMYHPPTVFHSTSPAVAGCSWDFSPLDSHEHVHPVPIVNVIDNANQYVDKVIVQGGMGRCE